MNPNYPLPSNDNLKLSERVSALQPSEPNDETIRSSHTDAFDVGNEIRTVIQLNRLGELISRPFLQLFAEDHNMTLTEYRVVIILASTPQCASQDVAETTGIHPMNISRAVARLRQAQLLSMAKDPLDHRRRLLSLTDTGWKTYHQMFPVAQTAATELFSVLQPHEFELFAEFLQRLGTQAETLVSTDTTAAPSA